VRTERYPHKIAAIYSDADHADAVADVVLSAARGDALVMRLDPESSDVDRGIEPEQRATRNHFIRDLLLGGGAGMAAGSVGAGAIAIGLPSLFVSVPVVGPLMVAGYGAMLGATAGGIKAFRLKEGLLADMVQDALERGFHVLVIHSRDLGTHDRVERIVGDTLAEVTLTV